MSGPYGVIIADPPWRYGGTGQFGGSGRSRASAAPGGALGLYPTMRAKDIAALPVAALAAADCVLLLWATWPRLGDAFDVLRAWGFAQVAGMPWVKVQHIEREPPRPVYGTGFWLRGCSEPILICRRGKPPLPRGGYVGLLSERFEHSRKPDNLHQYAEQFPGPYLEMFARRRQPGWDAWGDQAASPIALPAPAGEESA